MKSLLKEMQTRFTEQDQDKDGDQDFADVMIARMVASGMSKEDAIKKVKDKEYNEAVIAKDKDEAAEMAKDPKFKGVNIKVGEPGVNEGLRGALDEPYYIEVSLRDARKALNLFADKKNGFPEVTIYGSNVYASFNQDEIEDLMNDFGAYDIEVLDSNTEWEGDWRNPEPDEDIDEVSTSVGAGSYNTPYSFKKEKMKYESVAESMDKKYEALIESYKNFTTSNPKMSPEQKVKTTIKEMSRQLREMERTIEYTHRMKSESGIARESYGSSVQKALSEMSLRINKIAEKVRALGE